MVAMNLLPAVSLRPSPPGFSTASSLPVRRSISVSSAADSLETAVSPPQSPEIELEFLGPGHKPGDAVASLTAKSGEKLLRNIMLDNKIELYATYGKLMNCGGGGTCGTCIVEILEGSELLNEPTNTELRYLKRNQRHGD